MEPLSENPSPASQHQTLDFKKLGRFSQIIHQESRQGRRISAAFKKNSCNQLHLKTRTYLNSYAAKALASVEAIKGRRKVATSKDKKRALELAESLNVWESCAEKVFLHPKLKPNNSFDFRFILHFGEEQKARQILVRNALLHRFSVSPDQFMFGGGRNKAVQKAKKYYEQGYRYVIEVDVHKAFRSFDVDGIAKFLKLPKEVCVHVLSGMSLSVDLSSDYEKVIIHDPADSDGLTAIEEFAMIESDWVLARQGLTEGSKVSPFVSELLFAWVAERLPNFSGKFVNYADNFLLMGKSECEVMELELELRKLLREHPAGQLAVNPTELIQPSQGFQFLGYSLSPNGEALEAGPNEDFTKAMKRQRKGVYDLLRSDASVKKKSRAVNRLFKKQQASYNGFNLWAGGKGELRSKMRWVVKQARNVGVHEFMLLKCLRDFVKDTGA